MLHQDSNLFETESVDFASYLILEGVKFTGCKRSATNPRIVVFEFEDTRRNCLDLERVFMSSEYKKYRDINKWLLQQVHRTLKKD